MVGSTEFPLIWKEKATPAGRSISRLAPSMRRTSDSGSIGWPWGTPVSNPANGTPEDFIRRKRESIARGSKMGLSLSDLQMQALAWATPKASDGEGGRTTKTEGGGNAHLPIQARESAAWHTPLARDGDKLDATLPAQAFGTTQNSASAQTEKRGALNPEFVFWLQGFPTAWVVCALLSAKRGKGL